MPGLAPCAPSTPCPLRAPTGQAALLLHAGTEPEGLLASHHLQGCWCRAFPHSIREQQGSSPPGRFFSTAQLPAFPRQCCRIRPLPWLCLRAGGCSASSAEASLLGALVTSFVFTPPTRVRVLCCTNACFVPSTFPLLPPWRWVLHCCLSHLLKEANCILHSPIPSPRLPGSRPWIN